MHAIHPDRLRVLLAAAAATLLLILAAATLPRAWEDLSLSSGSSAAAPPQRHTSATASTPDWATNPLRSPLSYFER